MTKWAEAWDVWRRIPAHVGWWLSMWTRVLLSSRGWDQRDALGAAFRARLLADQRRHYPD